MVEYTCPLTCRLGGEMDGLYLDDPIERLKLAFCIVITSLLSITITIGLVAWLVTGDFQILFRTLMLLAVIVLAVVQISAHRASSDLPGPPDQLHPDMDIRSDDEH